MESWFLVLLTQVKHSSRTVEGVISTTTSTRLMAGMAAPMTVATARAVRLDVIGLALKFIMCPKLLDDSLASQAVPALHKQNVWRYRGFMLPIANTGKSRST